MGSFSQTLFFGGVKRQPEIRLRSQAIRLSSNVQIKEIKLLKTASPPIILTVKK